MKDIYQENDIKIRQSRFPVSLFWGILLAVLIVAGVHMGLMVAMEALDWNEIVEVHVILLYWILVALGLTLYTRKQMKKAYDEPLQKISQATERVAIGDFSVYISPTHTPDKLDYLDMMIMDINKMIEELGSIETLKTDFVSNVSHEMKTPLSIIKNYSEMLQAKDLEEERRIEYARTIEESASRMSALITNILKLNKLENQRITPEIEEFDVCRQICECILEYEPAWESKNIELDIDIEDEAYIKGDESLLELVWNNLISNAVKFTEPGGSIKVYQKTCDGKVQVAIEDTGCGMSEEARKHIFDKFYQGDTSHATEGNGLGLALAHRVLVLLDGEIQVESEMGKGSTFIVTLPAAVMSKKENEETL